jgi:hypothetical protein
MPAVDVHRAVARELTMQDRADIAKWARDFLATANFNSRDDARMLLQSATTIQRHYRQTLAGEYVVVSYDHPVFLPALGKQIGLVEIVIGLNRRDQYASALFTIDADASVTAHEKYAPLPIPASLQAASTTAPASMPADHQTRHDLSWTRFTNLRSDMTLEELYSQVGQPSRDLGSGTHILEYIVDGGERIYVGATGNKILYVRRFSVGGSDLLKPAN